MKIKKIRLSVIAAITILVTTSSDLSAQQAGIVFKHFSSFEEVLAAAQKEEKCVFVDLFATWCGPCKEMDRKVFTSTQVASFFNQNFISIKVQMDKTKNDDDLAREWYNDAEKLERIHMVKGFPTYLFFSPKGDLVNKVTGTRSATDLIEEAKMALNPENRFQPLLEKYQAKNLDTAYYKTLCRYASKLDQNALAEKIAAEYIKSLAKNIYDTDDLIFIAEFTHKSTDIGFNLLIDNFSKIKNVIKDKSQISYINQAIDDIIYNEQVVDPFSRNPKLSWSEMKNNLNRYGERGLKIYENTIVPIIINNEEIIPILKSGAKPDWTKVEKNLISKYGMQAQKVVWAAVAYTYYQAKDVKNFIKAKEKILKKYPLEVNEFKLNDDAWFVFENSKVRKELLVALKWSKSLVERSGSQNAGNLDTYANLLYKLNMTDEALIWERKAVDADPYNRQIAENYDKMLKGQPTWIVVEKKKE